MSAELLPTLYQGSRLYLIALLVEDLRQGIRPTLDQDIMYVCVYDLYYSINEYVKGIVD